MALEIKGIEKLSVIDYPGKTCCIVFLAGCNFRCPYCQNPDLIEKPDKLESIREEELFGMLRGRKKWIDGVCITGGEPCLHKELPGLIKRVKKEGFLVKLDTNGSNPGMLERLIKEGMVDYIAMDIKASPERYSELAGADVDTGRIKRSAEIIMKSGVDYEFRTTVVPGLFKREDVEMIGKWLKGAGNYFIQGFRPDNCLDRSFRKKARFSGKELGEFAGAARGFFKNVGVRE